MTAIPATLSVDNDTQAIALTLERLQSRALTPIEAEKDLLVLFDADVGADNRVQLLHYISGLSAKVEKGELDAQDAASDIKEMIGFWLARSDDIQHLLEIGSE
jgi:hypothetical protein